MTITGPTSPIGAHDTVVVDDGPGVAFVPASAPLIGLNYFDGRFLRADDLNLERRGQRTYVELSNRARGSGVVEGYDLRAVTPTTLSLSAGLAVDPQGRVLNLPVDVTADVPTLLGPSPTPDTTSEERPGVRFSPRTTPVAPATTSTSAGTAIFLVCLSTARAFCGEAEVLGRPGDGGCTTATDRPYLVDGVRLLLQPLDLDRRPFTVTGVTAEHHLRSQAAAAYFEQERDLAAGLLSSVGLGAAAWSSGARGSGRDVVPLALLGWDGSTITFLDTWAARRELVGTAADEYWATRLERRPWSVFLAQVLHFQSHLTAPPPVVSQPALPARILLERGVVELPPAGYLPVRPDLPDLRGQVQDLVGPGVALRLSAIPRDQIAREMERAQHLERISLLRAAQGREPEQVDVFVPDGAVVAVPARPQGVGWTADVQAGSRPLEGSPRTLPLTGAARSGAGPTVELRLALAGSGTSLTPLVVGLVNAMVGSGDLDELATRRPQPRAFDLGLMRLLADTVTADGGRQRAAAPGAAGRSSTGQGVAIWVALDLDVDPFSLAERAETRAEITLDLAVVTTTASRTSSLARATARVRGFLRREPAAGRNPDREIVVVLDGLLSLTVPTPAELAVPATGQYPAQVRAVLRRHDDGATTTYVLSDEADTRALAVSSSGSPAITQGALATRPPGGSGVDDLTAAVAGPPAELARRLDELETWRAPVALVARDDAAVVRPGGRHHDAAEAALAVLAGSAAEAPETDPREAGRRYRDMFPVEVAAATSEVRPSTDWVLFRRRTRKDHEGDAAAPPPESAPVTVWLRTEESSTAAAQVASAVRGGQWPDSGWRQVDVAFDPDHQTLLTPGFTWRERYREVRGGPVIAFAAYAGISGPAAAIVGPDRLAALLAATPPDGDGSAALVEVLTAPASLLLPATAGSAFLVTYSEQEVPAPELAVVAIPRSESDLGAAVMAGDADAVEQKLALLGVAGTLSPSDTDFADVSRELQIAMPEVTKKIGVGLWVDPDLADPLKATLIDLANRVTAAAAPTLTSEVLGPPVPIEVAPPADLRDAVLFFTNHAPSD